MTDHSLSWDQAKALAIAGAPVRRFNWVDRWIFFQRDLWWMSETDESMRIVKAEEFGKQEFLTSDWTTLPAITQCGAPPPPGTTDPEEPPPTPENPPGEGFSFAMHFRSDKFLDRPQGAYRAFAYSPRFWGWQKIIPSAYVAASQNLPDTYVHPLSQPKTWLTARFVGTCDNALAIGVSDSVYGFPTGFDAYGLPEMPGNEVDFTIRFASRQYIGVSPINMKGKFAGYDLVCTISVA